LVTGRLGFPLVLVRRACEAGVIAIVPELLSGQKLRGRRWRAQSDICTVRKNR
jgi:hypothetical protein